MFTYEYYKNKYPIFSKKIDEYDYFNGVYTPQLEPLSFIYNNVRIYHNDHIPIILYDKEDKQDAEYLVDYISFIHHKPTFILTGDEKLDSYLENLYLNSITFDEWELFSPLKSDDEVIHLKEINCPMVLALYNTAMKQPEPLSRCIFLFRIIEYYNSNVINENRNNLTNCIQSLYEECLSHEFIPIILMDSVYRSEYENNCIEKKVKNVIDEWKLQSQQTNDIWITNDENLAKNIYKRARCGIAHGNDLNSLILHDYSNDYKFIKEVNCFLELITRYIIESKNPHFKEYINMNFKKIYKTYEYVR
ncbi:hypothetical protein HNV12_23555 [Methanococcoides sp. SA1]|nr:hypothetical protein [Methanococcoides sp. SA1]